MAVSTKNLLQMPLRKSHTFSLHCLQRSVPAVSSGMLHPEDVSYTFRAGVYKYLSSNYSTFKSHFFPLKKLTENLAAVSLLIISNEQ